MNTKILTTIAALLALTSCSMMQDDRSDCPECVNTLTVRVKYDYNMQHDNQLEGQVGAVEVYAIGSDRQVKAVRTLHRQAGSALLSQDTVQFVKLPPDDYSLVAVAAQREFDVIASRREATLRPSLLSVGSMVTDLQMRMDRSAEADSAGRYAVDPQGEPIDTLWYACSTAPVTVTEQGGHFEELSLVRNTNRLVVNLYQIDNPTGLTAGDFTVRLLDQNGLLGSDNTVQADVPLSYHPFAAWTTEAIITGTASTRADAADRMAHYELDMSRLISHDDATQNPRLVIANNVTAEKVLDIDLVYYLLMMRSYASLRYSDQEFLDREHDFFVNIILKGAEWQTLFLGMGIDVTRWALRIQNEELK